MKNLDQDPAVLVSEERAKLFAPIQDKLKILMSKPNTLLQIEFETNQNSQKMMALLSSPVHSIFQSEHLLPQIL